MHEIGEIEVFIDGHSVITATGLILRDPGASESRIRGLHFQTFFGGKRMSALSYPSYSDD